MPPAPDGSMTTGDVSGGDGASVRDAWGSKDTGGTPDISGTRDTSTDSVVSNDARPLRDTSTDSTAPNDAVGSTDGVTPVDVSSTVDGATDGDAKGVADTTAPADATAISDADSDPIGSDITAVDIGVAVVDATSSNPPDVYDVAIITDANTPSDVPVADGSDALAKAGDPCTGDLWSGDGGICIGDPPVPYLVCNNGIYVSPEQFNDLCSCVDMDEDGDYEVICASPGFVGIAKAGRNRTGARSLRRV